MDELLAYAYLIAEGLDEDFEEFGIIGLLENRLDELYIADPENSDLLELEMLSGNIKEMVIYIRTHIDYQRLDRVIFGKTLMKLLKLVYRSMDIGRFGERMFSLWESLQGDLQDEEPFNCLTYADDPLGWGDEEQSRAIYEKMLSFYDEDDEEN